MGATPKHGNEQRLDLLTLLLLLLSPQVPHARRTVETATKATKSNKRKFADVQHKISPYDVTKDV